LGAIRTAVTAGEPGKIYFLSGKQCTISPISCWPNFTKFAHNMSIGIAMKLSEQNFEIFTVSGPKERKHFSKNFNVLRL